MKKFTFRVAFTLIAAFALSVAGCTEAPNADNNNDGTATLGDASVEVLTSSDSEAGYESSSAQFSFSVEGVESYTYVIHDGEVTTPSEAVLVYAEAEEIYDITSDGELTTAVYGLEGGETYTIEYVFKVADQENYLTQLMTVTTSEYKRLINMIAVDPNNIKFQVNFPDDKYYKVIFYDGSTYDSDKGSYDGSDYKNFAMIASDKVYFGQNVHEMIDGGTIVNEKYGNFTYRIKPAMTYVVIVAECDADGNIVIDGDGGNGGGGIVPLSKAATQKPILGDYTEICADTEDTITGLYARQNVTTMLPEPAKGDVEIIQKITERSATFTFLPSEDVVQYGYSFGLGNQVAAFENMPEGEAKQLFITSLTTDMTPCYEATQDGLVNLAPGDEFTMYVVYQSDKQGYTRSAKAISFKPIKSTMPKIELEITPAKAKDDNPYMVAFDIKAPNGDCQSITYLCNYTAQWEQLIYNPEYEGYDPDEIKDGMLTSYGTKLTAAALPDFFAAVNGAGYHMEFPSWENRESTLVMGTFNEEERINVVSCASMSAVEQDKEPVESELFDTLLGEWTGSIDKFQVGWELGLEEPIYYSKTFDAKIISDPGYDAPEAFNRSNTAYLGVVGHYMKLAIAEQGMTTEEAQNWAVEEVESQFQEFKELAKLYKAKYRGQNRLCLTGFGVIPDYVNYAATPWELFINLKYNAYDVEQMFYEYGPKMFLGIKADNSVVLESNTQYIAPFMSTTALAYQMTAISKTAKAYIIDQEFPVTIADDDNFSLEPVSYDGYDDFYISTGYFRAGTLWASVEASSPIKYTRKEASAKRSAPALNSIEQAKLDAAIASPMCGNGTFRRPYLPKTPVKLPSLMVELRDVKDAIAPKSKSVLAERLSK